MNDGKNAPHRQKTDRRKVNLGSPTGDDRRKEPDRRLIHYDGRERYLDMVQKERGIFLNQGNAPSTEQLLDLAGASATSKIRRTRRYKIHRGTGDACGSNLPVQYLVAVKHTSNWFI